MKRQGIQRVYLMSLFIFLAACTTVSRLAAMPLAATTLPLSTVADMGINGQSQNFLAPAKTFDTSDLVKSQDLSSLPTSPPSNALILSPLTADQFMLETPDVSKDSAGESLREYQRGSASWYGLRFHNRRTASGERYDLNALTAAHRTLPFGTIVRLRSRVNGYEVDVRINDRGPFGRSHVIDISRAAAKALGMLSLGVHDVILMVTESTPTLADAIAPTIKSK